MEGVDVVQIEKDGDEDNAEGPVKGIGDIPSPCGVAKSVGRLHFRANQRVEGEEEEEGEKEE